MIAPHSFNGSISCVMTFTSVFWAFHLLLGERGNLGGPWVGKMPSPRVGSVQFSSVAQLCLFATPWTAPHQASLSITNSQSLLKLMSMESMMPSNHLILCRSLLSPAFNLSQHQGLFQWVSSVFSLDSRPLSWRRLDVFQNFYPLPEKDH